MVRRIERRSQLPHRNNAPEGPPEIEKLLEEAMAEQALLPRAGITDGPDVAAENARAAAGAPINAAPAAGISTAEGGAQAGVLGVVPNGEDEGWDPGALEELEETAGGRDAVDAEAGTGELSPPPLNAPPSAASKASVSSLPPVPPLVEQDIPDAMRRDDNWVWLAGGAPYTSTGVRAEANVPQTWAPFAEVNEPYHPAGIPFDARGWIPRRGAGLGEITFGICIAIDGSLKEWAKPLVSPLMDPQTGIPITYAQVSPNGSLTFFGSFYLTWRRRYEFDADGGHVFVEASTEDHASEVTGEVWKNAPPFLTPIHTQARMVLDRAGHLARQNSQAPSPAQPPASASSSAASPAASSSSQAPSPPSPAQPASQSGARLVFDPAWLKKSPSLEAIRKHAIDQRDYGVTPENIRIGAHVYNQKHAKPADRGVVDALVDWILVNSKAQPSQPGATQRVNGHAAGSVQVSDQNEDEEIHVVPWPDRIPLSEMYGLVGDFVRLLAPHTEADPTALFLSILVVFGHVIGRDFFFRIGSQNHCGNLGLFLVGPTASGRKGTAASDARATCTVGDLVSGLGNVVYGVSTGEGLITQIRDPIIQKVYDSKAGKSVEREIDPGVKDKRLLIQIDEASQLFAVMRRSGNTLSPVARHLFDNDYAESPTKTSPVKVRSGAHVSWLVSSTQPELIDNVGSLDAENGFLNRFMFACSIRSKWLPDPRGMSEVFRSEEWRELQKRFNKNTYHPPGAPPEELVRDADAQDEWGRNEATDRGMYRELSRARTGLWGAITARAPQLVSRMTLVHAVVNGELNEDGARHMTKSAQNAAYAAWHYCDQSAQRIFSAKSDPDQDRILLALQKAGRKGMTRSEIRDLFGNKKPAEEIALALTRLARAGLAFDRDDKTGGRPAKRWWVLETGADL
jgi:hypothetical protein